MLIPEVERLRRRVDFLAAAKGRRSPMRSLVLQMLPTGRDTARIGFTVSRKVGNSVERNRVKRRLREAVRASLVLTMPGHDYVLVGRRAALTVPYGQIVADLETALKRVHRPMKTDG